MLRSLVMLVMAFCTGSSMAASNELLFKNGFERPIWVSGYHVGYQNAALPIDQVNFDDITHLMVGAIVPNTDGSLDTTFFIDAVNGPIWAHSAVDAAHAHARKAILMIGGAGAITGWRGAASATNLNAFVANLSAAANTYGADGLDIDWEPVTDNNLSNAQITADHTELASFVTALRAARPDLLLTMPVGAYNPNYPPAVNEQSLFTTLSTRLDQINLMSYAIAYAGFGWDSWFSSALAGEMGSAPLSVSSSIAYYRDTLGIPAVKLGVGIGFYGLCYQNVTAPRQPTGVNDIVSADDNAMTYVHIVNTYLPNMTYHYDAIASAPWLTTNDVGTTVGSPACSYVTYEDATSIAAKGAYVLSNGLGGTIIWTIGEGHIGPGNDPVLDATGAAFLGP